MVSKEQTISRAGQSAANGRLDVFRGTHVGIPQNDLLIASRLPHSRFPSPRAFPTTPIHTQRALRVHPNRPPMTAKYIARKCQIPASPLSPMLIASFCISLTPFACISTYMAHPHKAFLGSPGHRDGRSMHRRCADDASTTVTLWDTHGLPNLLDLSLQPRC